MVAQHIQQRRVRLGGHADLVPFTVKEIGIGAPGDGCARVYQRRDTGNGRSSLFRDRMRRAAGIGRAGRRERLRRAELAQPAISLIRLQWRQHILGIETQLVYAHVVEAEIGRRRLDRRQRAIAKQLFEAGPLEDAVRAAQGQRRARNPARGLAYNVFRAVQCGGRLRCRPLRVARPGRPDTS